MKEEKKKCLLIAKTGGGTLITKKRKKAFTLIELLAIIVILAIIAVITVPIILNIIENSRRGATTDSAYGYKDSVNKWYVSKLSEDHDFKISGEYSVTNGVLNGLGVNNVEIPVSGDKPSSGKLHYTNNVLDDGCLVIGDYKITFKPDGSVNETVKGNCDDYQFVNLNTIPTIASCPGCKFISESTTYSTLSIGENIPLDATNDYTELIENGYPIFLGFKESETNLTEIERVFVCGIEGTTAFCLEGDDSEKFQDNISVLNKIQFKSCEIDENSASCVGDNVNVSIYFGDVTVQNDNLSCTVWDSNAHC